jgi:uncharacterized membrane protein
MNKVVSITSVLSAALALLALQTQVRAADAAKDPMTPELKQKLGKLEKCYGINAASKNDCATAIHGCATEASMVRDPKSFVLLPSGDCLKIAGGATSPT